MSTYRLVFIDAAGCSVTDENIDAHDRVGARALAETILLMRSHHHAVEIWRGGRMIDVVSRNRNYSPSPAAAASQ